MSASLLGYSRSCGHPVSTQRAHRRRPGPLRAPEARMNAANIARSEQKKRGEQPLMPCNTDDRARQPLGADFSKQPARARLKLGLTVDTGTAGLSGRGVRLSGDGATADGVGVNSPPGCPAALQGYHGLQGPPLRSGPAGGSLTARELLPPGSGQGPHVWRLPVRREDSRPQVCAKAARRRGTRAIVD